MEKLLEGHTRRPPGVVHDANRVDVAPGGEETDPRPPSCHDSVCAGCRPVREAIGLFEQLAIRQPELPRSDPDRSEEALRGFGRRRRRLTDRDLAAVTDDCAVGERPSDVDSYEEAHTSFRIRSRCVE